MRDFIQLCNAYIVITDLETELELRVYGVYEV